MKGDPSVIQHLQKALTMELTAVHQYMLHAHVLDNWGLGALGTKLREEMHEELGHANRLLARMMFLEGAPDMTALGSVARAQTLKDMFEADLRDEYEARSYYTEAAAACNAASDIGSRDLFAGLVHEEEGHAQWLETQIDLIGRLGEQGYMQLHVGAGLDAEGEANAD